MNHRSSPPRPAASIELDTDGRVVGWSAGAEHLLGWTTDEAVGMASRLFIPERNRARYDKEVQRVAAGPYDRTGAREISVLHRRGHELRVNASITRTRRDEEDRIVNIVSAVAAPVADTFEQPLRYRAILDQIEDGCCVTDLRGYYLYVNDAFCRMFNYERSEIVGKSFSQSTGEERVSKIFHVYSEVYRTGIPTKAFEYEVFPRDRPPLFIEQSVSLERDQQGRPIAFVSISRDCTARKKAEQAIEQARIAAERARIAAEDANRAKSEFLANMSHEIRTPMNGIIGMATLALDSDLTPYQADCISTLQSSAQSLLSILNDILDFSKIESRKLTLERVPFRLSTLIDERMKPLSVSAAQKGLELRVTIRPDVPERLIGDPVRLAQVLTNLVGNALKFTVRGRIEVTVGLDARSEGGALLRFSVADTGIGIDASHLSSIFDPFTQADGSTTRRFGGTGLGLAISSNLVAMMGGRLWVESVVGEGSVFSFTADLGLASTAIASTAVEAVARAAQPPTPDTVVGARSGPPSPPAQPLAILVAEDNIVNQRVARGLLAKRGHLVTIVANGRDALDAIERQQFDVVLMDVQMPDMGGFEATAILRERERGTGRHQRVIAMTAHAMSGDRDRCLAAGMDGYLSKPLDAEALARAVESGLVVAA
jgi:PAS domain S-box-containing protein